jgi:glucose-1-phosphate thymidylyltransferase
MHQYLIAHQREILGPDTAQNLQTQKRELYMGNVFQLAIEEGLSIETVIFPKGSCIDIGTPEDLMKALNSRK